MTRPNHVGRDGANSSSTIYRGYTCKGDSLPQLLNSTLEHKESLLITMLIIYKIKGKSRENKFVPEHLKFMSGRQLFRKLLVLISVCPPMLDDVLQDRYLANKLDVFSL